MARVTVAIRAVQAEGESEPAKSRSRARGGWRFGGIGLQDSHGNIERDSSGRDGGEPTVAQRAFELRNKHGFHARAATQFVQLVNHFKSEVEVEKDGQRQDGRSVVGMLMLLAGKGSSIIVRCRGRDAPALLDAISKLVADGFGEQA